MARPTKFTFDPEIAEADAAIEAATMLQRLASAHGGVVPTGDLASAGWLDVAARAAHLRDLADCVRQTTKGTMERARALGDLRAFAFAQAGS